MGWQTVLRPGYLGKDRDERFKEWDALYGRGFWQLGWVWDQYVLCFEEVCSHYEDAYTAFLGHNSEVLNGLVLAASDVFDDNPSNTQSGVDYTKQETNRTHIQDIAIRRALRRLNRQFEGKELIQIRQEKGTHLLSIILSPGKVPFHKPRFIVEPWLTGWWDPGTVECFYQSNRVLQVMK